MATVHHDQTKMHLAEFMFKTAKYKLMLQVMKYIWPFVPHLVVSGPISVYQIGLVTEN